MEAARKCMLQLLLTDWWYSMLHSFPAAWCVAAKIVQLVHVMGYMHAQDLTDLADRMAHSIEVKDRYRHLKKYQLCFTGASSPWPAVMEVRLSDGWL